MNYDPQKNHYDQFPRTQSNLELELLDLQMVELILWHALLFARLSLTVEYNFPYTMIKSGVWIFAKLTVADDPALTVTDQLASCEINQVLCSLQNAIEAYAVL